MKWPTFFLLTLLNVVFAFAFPPKEAFAIVFFDHTWNWACLTVAVVMAALTAYFFKKEEID